MNKPTACLRPKISCRWLARFTSVLLGFLVPVLPSPLAAYTQANLQTASDGTIETIPLEATVQESPARITIKTYAAGTFSIYRKSPSDTSWGTALATSVALGIEGTWADNGVAVGTAYEYRFVNTAGTTTNSVYPSGYILCGIKVDQTQIKGRMAVVVASDLPASLPAEYAQYKADLAADGWVVHEIQVPRAANYTGIGNGAIASVKVNAGGTGSTTGDIVRLVNSSGKIAAGTLTVSSGAITAVSIGAGAGGTGFAVNDTLTVQGGTSVGKGASLTGHVDLTKAALGSATVVRGGSGYTEGNVVTLTGQTSGKTAQATIHVSGGTGVGNGTGGTDTGQTSAKTTQAKSSGVAGGGTTKGTSGTTTGALSYFTINSSQTGFVASEVLVMTGNTTGSGVGPLTSYVSSGALSYVYINPSGTGYVEGDSGTLTGNTSGKTAQVTLHLSGGYISYFSVNSSQTGFVSGEILTLSGTSAGSGAGPFTASVVGSLQSVTVNSGGSGYVDGNVVTINYGTTPAQGTLSVTGGVITAVNVTSSGAGFTEGNSLSLSNLQSTASGYNLTVNTVDNSHAGRSVTVTAGGSGYRDNDTVTIKGASATATGSLIAPSGTITGISVVLPNTFTPGETLTLTPLTGGSGATATAGANLENHLLIRSAVQAINNAYPGQLKNVVMVGKVPVCRSGINDGAGSDGHGNEAPYGTDAFYADMDGVIGTHWTDTQDNSTNVYTDWNVPADKQFDQQKISQVGNGVVELGFGRIDLSLNIQTEVEAMRSYFNKLHRYKIASPDFLPGRAVCDRLTYANEREADLQAMPGVVGMNNIQFIKTTDLPSVQAGQDADQLYTTQHGPYLFYFKGSGGPQSGVGGKAVFWTGMQSHWGYWYQSSLVSSGANTMQLRLAENSFTLDFTWNIWGLRYIYHRMGMGLDAGDMLKQSINNQGWTTGPYTYKFNNTSNGDYHGVLYMNQMGDPALRLFMFAPPSALSVVKTGGRPVLTWQASSDSSVTGYHVYRAPYAGASFTRLTSAPLTSTTYTDTSVSTGSYLYTVRAIRLETTGGGTFYNSSLGISQSLNLDATPTAVSIATTTLPTAYWKTPTTLSLAAQGGVPQYVWTLSAGALPTGLTLSTSGVISGTPTDIGTFPITVLATDQTGQTASQSLSVVVNSNSQSVLYPTATTYTLPTAPTNSYGTAEVAVVSGAGSETFHRYDLSGVNLNNGFVKATLYLYVTSGTTTNAYAPVQANLLTDAANGWVDKGISKFFTGYSNNGANKVHISCPAHGFTTGIQVTLAGLSGTGAPTGPYAITVVDADNFDIPVTYSASWSYDPALSYATTASVTYNTRPTAYAPNVPTLTATGTDTPGTFLQMDVTPFVQEVLANFPSKQMGLRFFTQTNQTVTTGTLNSFGNAIPYLVVQTSNAPKIVFNSPAISPAAIYGGSSVYLDTTVTPLPARAAALTLQWSQVSGPGTATFSKPTAASTGVKFSALGDYVLQLTANDGVAQSSQTVTVRVLKYPQTGPPLTGPIDHISLRLPFDETSGTTANDASGAAAPHPGTLASVNSTLPTWSASGVAGGALSFAGTGQRVDVPDSAANPLDGTQQLTISAWIYANAVPANGNIYAAIVAKRTASFNKESYTIKLRGGSGTSASIYSGVAGGNNLVGGTQVLPNRWYHLVMVYDGTLSSNNLKSYVNGFPDAIATYAGTSLPNNVTSALRIGALDNVDTTGFNGLIDEVRIYNRALTQTEVQDLAAVMPSNLGPVISATSNLSGTTNQPLTLSAAVMDDGKPVPGTLTYRWSQLSGPSTLVIANPTSLSTSTTPGTPGTYELLLTVSDGSITTSANITATITAPAQVTYSNWASSHGLTGANASPTAVVAGDGLNNLYKYALGLDPSTHYNPNDPGLPKVFVQSVSGVNYLVLSFNGVATDVVYKVQASSDLTGPWTDVQVFQSGTAPGSVNVQDSQPMSASPARFMRLIMSLP